MPDRIITKTPKFPFVFIALNVALIIGVYFLLSDNIMKTLRDAVLTTTEHSNATITRVFVNEVYPDLESALELTENPAASKDELSAAELNEVDSRVRLFMLGTDILKIKIYNVKGVTVYSSDPAQIGEVENDNHGFEQAVRGSAVSQITYRGKFSGFDGEVYDRDLIASYIPIFSKFSSIIGVAEVYTDRTRSIDFVEDKVLNIQSILIPTLSIILLFATFVIWRVFQFAVKGRIHELEHD